MDGTQIRTRFDELCSLRRTLDDTFEKIQKYVVPYRGDFFSPLTSENEVEWRKRGLYDSTAPIAADLLASSIHSNLTSPMIPWFQLRFRDDALNKIQSAAEWLETVQDQIWQTLQESDFNMEVAEIYLDLVSFATAVLFQEELSDDDWQGMTFTASPIRDTYFEHGANDKVLRVYRRLQYTELQLKDRFPDHDFETLLQAARKNDQKDGDVDRKYDVVFCVYERPDVVKEFKNKPYPKRMAPKARPWGCKYVLHNTGEVLEEDGYYRMPAHVVRWKKVAGSRWGHGPAFICLSDILQLNATVAMVSEARAKEVDPPMKSTERGILTDLDLRPGGLTQVAEMDELDRLLQVNQGLFNGELEIERLQQSIRSTFYVDKLELKESPAMTATEVLARLDRQQRQFAPTLGRLQADLLDPLIEFTFDALMRNNRIPEIPEEVRDRATDLDVEYTGPIPRSMKNEEAQGTSLWIGELGGLAPVIPDILDVVDTDRLARGLGLARGVPAGYMRSAEDVKAIREQRAKQQAAMQQMELAKQAGDAAKSLGEGGMAMGNGAAGNA